MAVTRFNTESSRFIDRSCLPTEARLPYNVTKRPTKAIVVVTVGTRQRLIESTLRLIHAGSYGAVSVNDICADAGVKKGSFYHFFPSKRDVTLAAIEAQWEKHRIGHYDRAFAADIPPLARIIRFFDMLPVWATEIATGGKLLGCPFGNLGAEMATEDHVIREKIREVLVDRLAGYFAHAVQEASEAGDIGRVNVQAAAARLVAYTEGVYLIAKVEDDPEVFVRLGRAALGLITEPSR